VKHILAALTPGPLTVDIGFTNPEEPVMTLAVEIGEGDPSLTMSPNPTGRLGDMWRETLVGSINDLEDLTPGTYTLQFQTFESTERSGPDDRTAERLFQAVRRDLHAPLTDLEGMLGAMIHWESVEEAMIVLLAKHVLRMATSGTDISIPEPNAACPCRIAIDMIRELSSRDMGLDIRISGDVPSSSGPLAIYTVSSHKDPWHELEKALMTAAAQQALSTHRDTVIGSTLASMDARIAAIRDELTPTE
jgi:hypothetical protein